MSSNAEFRKAWESAPEPQRTVRTTLTEQGHAEVPDWDSEDAGLPKIQAKPLPRRLPVFRRPSDYKALPDRDPLAICPVLALGELAMMGGYSGLGKSTAFVSQLGYAAACAGDFFGMVFYKAVRVLAICGENGPHRQKLSNLGALTHAEKIYTPEQCKLIDENYADFIINDTSLPGGPENSPGTGEAFLAWLDMVLTLDPRGLVILDPYAAISRVGFTDQEGTTAFLRDGLQAIATRHSCCILVIHHYGKPSKDQAGAALGMSIQYKFCGTSEMPNFFRLFIAIEPTELIDSDGKRVYQILSDKRMVPWSDALGNTKDDAGQEYDRMYIRHSPEIWAQNKTYAWEYSPVSPSEGRTLLNDKMAQEKAAKAAALAKAKKAAKESDGKADVKKDL